MPKIPSIWSRIWRCWPVTQTTPLRPSSRRSACTTGAILIASGRVPNTVRTFCMPELFTGPIAGAAKLHYRAAAAAERVRALL